MSEIKNKILNRIKEKKYGAFTSADFVDIGNYKLISKTLERLEDEKILSRARRGVYYVTKYNEALGIEEAPNINEIALAIARQFNIVITPSGNYALNIIGLSTQVPSKYIYITNLLHFLFDCIVPWITEFVKPGKGNAIAGCATDGKHAMMGAEQIA